LWHLNDEPPHFKEAILACGSTELVINLRKDELRIFSSTQPDRFTRYSGAVISPPNISPFATDTEQHGSLIGVHFRPGGAFPFLGVEAHELGGHYFNLQGLWGRAAIELRERLCEAATPEERFRLLEKTLIERMVGMPRRHLAVQHALDAFTKTGSLVRDVVRDVGLSQRRFIELFNREVGISPKIFCRVQRFRMAIKLTRQPRVPNWCELAANCGYFDQSHLIRDNKCFANLSPAEYHRRWNLRPLCWMHQTTLRGYYPQAHVPLVA
jgi:AraC-like DNA-binding protein